MMTTCWIGPFGFGAGDGVGDGVGFGLGFGLGAGLCFFAEVGLRFDTGFLIRRPVYGLIATSHPGGLSRYREGYAN
jgi:hypothetical protein